MANEKDIIEGFDSGHCSRRRMLLGIAAASAAAAVPAARAGASLENPELVRLAEELPAVEARYIAAREEREDIRRVWSSKWPLAPDEIAEPRRWRGSGYHCERGLEGGALIREGEEHPRYLTTAADLECQVERAGWVLKGKRLRRRNVAGMNRQEWETELAEAERLHAIAARYEAEIASIKKESNYESASKHAAATAEALEAHVSAIMTQPELSMDGLIIKAQALAAWGKVEPLYRIPYRHGQDWHGQIAASILRHAQSA